MLLSFLINLGSHGYSEIRWFQMEILGRRSSCTIVTFTTVKASSKKLNYYRNSQWGEPSRERFSSILADVLRCRCPVARSARLYFSIPFGHRRKSPSVTLISTVGKFHDTTGTTGSILKTCAYGGNGPLILLSYLHWTSHWSFAVIRERNILIVFQIWVQRIIARTSMFCMYSYQHVSMSGKYMVTMPFKLAYGSKS